MLLRIIHKTRYHYQSPVVQALHKAHLQPLTDSGQRVLAHHLLIYPQPTWREQQFDAFGNACTLFALQQSHEHLQVWADSLVQTDEPAPLGPSPAWESVREALRFCSGAPFSDANEFVFASPFAPIDDIFADFARPAFAPERPFLQACYDLMQKIHTQLKYQSASTEVHTPARVALQQGTGVCQDFAHIMLACLRSLGLPACYRSGYMLTQPPAGQPRLIGADASHAWVAVPLDGQWFDFDPTNLRCGMQRPGADYVRLASGRDFGDVSPLRGVIRGGGEHSLEVRVTVAPPEELDALGGAAPGA